MYLQIKDNYRKVDDRTAQRHWDYWYEFTKDHCMHGFKCVRRSRGGSCDYGQRMKEVHMIGGAVLPVWKVSAAFRGGGPEVGYR